MSTTIYTASPLRDRATQSLAFLERGIKGLNTGKLNDVFTVGLPHVAQTAYPEYCGNLSAFLHATSVQAKVTCGGFHEVSIPGDLIIPLQLPTLALSPVEPFKNEDERTTYLSQIAEENETTLLFRKEIVIVRNPVLGNLPSYPETVPDVICSVDVTNLNGMFEYVRTLKILSLFLATHSYPAFQTPVASDKDQIFQLDVEFAYMESETAPCEGHRGRSVTYNSAPDGVYKTDETFKCVEAAVEARLSGDHGYTAAGKVNVAKPAPLYPSINYGRASQVPNLPGFLLPYFKGMTFPCKEALVSTVRRYFPNVFGNNYEDNVDGWQEWVKGVNSWYRSEAGVQLTHIFYCIQTALESQARLFVILDTNNKYQGCTILGYRFSIWANGFTRDLGTALELRRDCTSLDAHSVALETITNVLKQLDVDEENLTREVGEMLSTRDVYREINLRTQAKDTVLEQLTKAVGDLSFSESYYTLDIDKVAKMMKTLLADPFPADEVSTWPMYLDPTLVYNRSKFHQCLSAFGPTAPSFLDVGGTTLHIPKGLEADDPLSAIDETTRKPKQEKLYVTGKKIFLAISDMQNVFDKRTIRQNNVERAGVFRTVAYTGRSRDLIWNMLKLIPFVAGDEKGKKRGIEEVSAAEGSGKDKVARVKAKIVRKKFVL